MSHGGQQHKQQCVHNFKVPWVHFVVSQSTQKNVFAYERACTTSSYPAQRINIGNTFEIFRFSYYKLQFQNMSQNVSTVAALCFGMLLLGFL